MTENFDQAFANLLRVHSRTLGPGPDDSVGEAARQSLTPEGYVNETTEIFLKDLNDGGPITRIRAINDRERGTALLLRMKRILELDNE
jgi:hypothetical protein